MGQAAPRDIEERRAEIDHLDLRQLREPRAEELQIASGACAQLHDAIPGSRGQTVDEVATAVQQPLAEGVVGLRLRRIEALQPLGVRAAARRAPRQGKQDTRFG